MPNKLFLTLLSVVPLILGSCADHASTSLLGNGPAAPINDPDTHLLPNPGENSLSEPGTSTSESTSSRTGTSGGSTSNSSNGSGSEPSTGGSNNGPGGSQNEGGSQANPVPEPGTLLLFGTGLAGLAGASLRRRRRKS